ncbi:MAG: hypothetical protein IKO48_07215 [Elusimicrobia bacterium]|nr:hypothetical protein [Elusimicrobiota bacterium]
MAKKKEEQKQEEKTTVEEVGVNPTNDIEQANKAEETPVSETPVSKTQKCGRCGAKIVNDGHQCPVCAAPTSWER